MEHALRERVGDLVVQTGLYVIQHAQLREQADVLERTGNAQFTNFMWLFADEVLSVQTDAAVGRRYTPVSILNAVVLLRRSGR